MISQKGGTGGKFREFLFDLSFQKIVSSPEKSYCFFYSNDTIIQQPAAHHNITKTLVYETKAFIYNHENDPFFYMLNFLHLHDSLFAGPEFQASSKRGKCWFSARVQQHMNSETETTLLWRSQSSTNKLREVWLQKELFLYIFSHNYHPNTAPILHCPQI